MKVKELIEALSKLDGELVVYGYSDHGQIPQIVSSSEVAFVEEEAYQIWESMAWDDVEAEEMGFTQKIVVL